jgi:ABC-type cobalamin/Fe3+-siderophores transport system ATPase subunit
MKLQRIVVDGHEEELNNIVIIIGPNGSGKTTF